jgi:hypothetical protein
MKAQLSDKTSLLTSQDSTFERLADNFNTPHQTDNFNKEKVITLMSNVVVSNKVHELQILFQKSQ